MPPRISVNIVGGGIAGLIAAVELARAGVKVRVFEAAAEPWRAGADEARPTASS